MSLLAKLLDAQAMVRLYGTTPPREASPREVVETVSAKLVERLNRLPLDGFVVYDIQDESSRTAVPRPFPFTRTVDPRAYADLLSSKTGTPAIAYKCVGDMSEAVWRAWLDETARDYAIGHLAIVGRPTSRGAGYPLSLTGAIRIAAEHERRFTVGGVTIAERHAQQSSESRRMIDKASHGASFFVSQTVYHAEATVRMLFDYANDCAHAGVKPRRVVLTFAPVGREKTLAFMKWLGISIAPETEGAIQAAASPLAKSIEICRANLARILEQDYVGRVPLGINVESVSINKDEIDASVDLFHALSGVLAERAALLG
ncbi:MAG: hypothetical protein ACREVR_06375 [Burkholderiales bacterium]